MSKKPALPPDAEVIKRLLGGDERMFNAVVKAYHPMLVRLVRPYVDSVAVAEEAAQEAWMGVLKGLGRFEGRSSLKTWICRIAINQAKTRGKKERRSVPFSNFESEENDGPVGPERFKENGMWAKAPTPFGLDAMELLENEEIRGVILQAVETLPPNQKLVITLRDIEGFDAAEVCNTLEITDTNQRVLLHRARSRVRKSIADWMAAQDERPR
jgi:RNA polymerase sigma-70 factor (ECF subfamily)